VLSSPLWRRSIYLASPNTVAAYRGDLGAFSRFLGDVAVETITGDQIRKYLARIPNRATRQRRLAGIKRRGGFGGLEATLTMM
jgi:site-specific recombinase XerD